MIFPAIQHVKLYDPTRLPTARFANLVSSQRLALVPILDDGQQICPVLRIGKPYRIPKVIPAVKRKRRFHWKTLKPAVRLPTMWLAGSGFEATPDDRIEGSAPRVTTEFLTSIHGNQPENSS
jgi:hypothetical protein